MTEKLQQRILSELEQIALIDPHTHINPHAAASNTLADILGYHYYTELAHSAGLPRAEIEESGIDPKEKVRRLVPKLADLDNTVQVSWFLEICRAFFGFTDDRVTEENWEALYDAAAAHMGKPDWEQQVLEKTKLEQVFLTNDFDDPLEGFDTTRYVPCLRADDLVFHLTQPDVRDRLSRATDVSLSSFDNLVRALGVVFEHFHGHGVRACAISLPPHFQPQAVAPATAESVCQRVLSGEEPTADDAAVFSQAVFWTLAGFCADYKLPFDLMIGVNRRVYEGGVFQGQDLFDQRVSLIQYRDLFNAFPQVVFPVSVLANTSNHELVSFSWIFPNVVTCGHWWYSNIPAYIETDCRSRLQAVPRNKQIGYYSDMYKLEFALPKFRMYRRVLSKVLASEFVIDRGWSETTAVELGKQVLRGNIETIF